MNKQEKEAMQQILSGRIENPYIDGMKDIQKRMRKYVKKGEKVPKELEEEYNAQIEKLCAWKI